MAYPKESFFRKIGKLIKSTREGSTNQNTEVEKAATFALLLVSSHSQNIARIDRIGREMMIPPIKVERLEISLTETMISNESIVLMISCFMTLPPGLKNRCLPCESYFTFCQVMFTDWLSYCENIA